MAREPEQGIPLAEPASGRGEGRTFLARTRIFELQSRATEAERCIPLARRRATETDSCTSVSERCISLAQSRIFELQSGATEPERCISLAQRRVFRSQAIAMAIAGCIFDANATPRTNAKPVFGRLAALFLARSSVSPRRMRIFQAQRCTRKPQVRSFRADGRGARARGPRTEAR